MKLLDESVAINDGSHERNQVFVVKDTLDGVVVACFQVNILGAAAGFTLDKFLPRDVVDGVLSLPFEQSIPLRGYASLLFLEQLVLFLLLHLLYLGLFLSELNLNRFSSFGSVWQTPGWN